MASPGINVDQLNQVNCDHICPNRVYIKQSKTLRGSSGDLYHRDPSLSSVFVIVMFSNIEAGKNAVMYAADQGRVEVCRLLLKGFIVAPLILVVCNWVLEGADKWEAEEEDRAVRKSRLDRLLDQVSL